MKTIGRVLVLGDNVGAALAAVRSLGRRGHEIVLAIQDRECLARSSRFVCSTVCLPDSSRPLAEWYDAFRLLLSQQHFDLVIPITDVSLVPLVRRRNEFERSVRLAIPSDRAFEYSYFKNKTYEMALSLDVPVPQTHCVSTQSEIPEAIRMDQWGFPAVVKPIASKVWKHDVKVEVPVSIVHDAMGFTDALARGLSVTPMLIQSFHPGIGIGQEFLVSDGEIVHAFQHERIHEPLRGGGSTYRRSSSLDSELLEYSTRMLRYLNWTGVVMVEYKRDPATTKVVLMEINGRFWGSLPLAIAAGVDFPADLYKLLVEDRRPAPQSYRAGVYCRKLTDDLYWFADNWRADRSDPHLLTTPRLRYLTEWFNILRCREHWDSLAGDDPSPALKEIASLFRTATRSLKAKASTRLLTLIMRSRLWRYFQRRRLRANLKRKPEMLFVCFGNICRSAFAEAYASRQFEKHGLDVVKVGSAGTYGRSNRKSPETARAVCREFDISLEKHRSRSLDESLIQSAGAIVCMDLRNYGDVLRKFPGARSKTFMLGALSQDKHQIEIPDPWSMPSAHFRKCFGRISEAIDSLVRTLSYTLLAPAERSSGAIVIRGSNSTAFLAASRARSGTQVSNKL